MKTIRRYAGPGTTTRAGMRWQSQKMKPAMQRPIWRARSINKKQLPFVTFCIGSVSAALGMKQAEVYRRLASSGILMEYIVPSYDVLHTFSREYLVHDIIGLMRERGVLERRGVPEGA